MPPKGSKKATSASAHSFSIGDIVLGRIKGYPPWPAKIVDPEKEIYLSKAVRALKPGKVTTFLLRYYDDGNYAWQKPAEIKPLSQNNIEDFLNGEKKSTGSLYKAYKVAKDPSKWEQQHSENMEAQKKREEEKAAGVDELDSEDGGADGGGKKRKRKEPAKKSAGKKAKKAAHSEDELEDKPAKKPKPTAAEESAPGFKQCKEWRRELQKSFLTKSLPEDSEMPKFDTMLKDIAEYQDKLEYLEANKLPKVIKRIGQLENIPRDAEFNIKTRCGQIVDQWAKAFGKVSNEGSGEPSKQEVEDIKKAIDGGEPAGGQAIDESQLENATASTSKMDVDEVKKSEVAGAPASENANAPASAPVLLNGSGEPIAADGSAPPAESTAA